MSYKLFLDDVRRPEDVKWIELPPGPWGIVRNYADFVLAVENRGMPDHISFDHDLADEHYKNQGGVKFTEKTGYDCVKWLCEYCALFGYRLPKYTVHSLNPVGRDRIIRFMESFRQNHIK